MDLRLTAYHRKCYNCGEVGHLSRDCPSDQVRPEWYSCDLSVLLISFIDSGARLLQMQGESHAKKPYITTFSTDSKSSNLAISSRYARISPICC